MPGWEEIQESLEDTMHDSLVPSQRVSDSLVSPARLMREVVQLRAAALVSGGALASDAADELVARVRSLGEEHSSLLASFAAVRRERDGAKREAEAARRDAAGARAAADAVIHCYLS